MSMYPSVDRKSFLLASGGMLAALALSGCVTSGGGDAPDTSSAGTGDSGGKKIAMVIDQTISDGGWGTSSYDAMTGAAGELGWDTAYSENVTQSDWVSTMQMYADEGYDVIFMPGNQYSDAVKQAASDNPDTRFIQLNSDAITDMENVECLVPDTLQIGQLAGALAALLTKSKIIGFIGAMEIDTTKSKLDGYTRGAQKIDPSIRVTSAYAGSFTDTAKGKEIGLTMLGDGMDVLFGDASAVENGAREAMSQKGGTFDIGQPSDMGSADDPIIACSVVTDNQTLLASSLRSIEDGSFGKKVTRGDLSNGGVKVGTFSSIVPADIQKQYLDYVEQIKAGSFIN